MEPKEAIAQVNKFVKQFLFFEFNVYSLSERTLLIVGSDELEYYHTLEIHLKGVFHISSKIDWRVDVEKTAIEEVSGEDLYTYSLRNRIEVGTSTIKFIDEDGIEYYFSFTEMYVNEKLVKYDRGSFI